MYRDMLYEAVVGMPADEAQQPVKPGWCETVRYVAMVPGFEADAIPCNSEARLYLWTDDDDEPGSRTDSIWLCETCAPTTPIAVGRIEAV